MRQDTAGAQLKYSHYVKDGRLVWQRDEPAGKRISNVYLAGSLVAEFNRPIGSTTETLTYLHTDALGSPIAKTNAVGSLIETSEYEPYGKLLNRANDDRAGYTGHVMDAGTGLTYMQQRYYDSGIGRFLSVDPVTADSSSGGNFNRYWYANNNPYKFTDPDGRQVCIRSRSMLDRCNNDPMGSRPRQPSPSGGCQQAKACLDGGSDTPNTDRRVKNGGKDESGSLGEDLAKDAVNKLSDEESWKRNANNLADNIYGAAKKGSVCTAICALENFVGVTPGEVTKNIGEETTEKALERGFKEADMLKSMKGVKQGAAVLKIVDAVGAFICSADCMLKDE